MSEEMEKDGGEEEEEDTSDNIVAKLKVKHIGLRAFTVIEKL